MQLLHQIMSAITTSPDVVIPVMGPGAAERVPSAACNKSVSRLATGAATMVVVSFSATCRAVHVCLAFVNMFHLPTVANPVETILRSATESAIFVA